LEKPAVARTGDEALRLLKDGNARFVENKPAVKEIGETIREGLAAGQKPLAIVLSCSDSRVPPEMVFDQGLGDLFIIRVAGNVVDPVALGSIEYAAEHLHTPLLVVMGHSKCGAVTAAVEGGELLPNIAAIAEKISPAVRVARAGQSGEEELIEAAVTENVKKAIKDIEKNSPALTGLVESGKLKIVGAKYELKTGEVEFFEK